MLVTDITDLYLGIAAFTLIVSFLVAFVMFARSRLIPSGNVNIEINGDPSKTITVPTGDKLLSTLASKNIYLASACGGGGTCSECKCQVVDGGGSILPTETSHFNYKQQNDNWRLSCQVPVKRDMKIQIPEEVFGVEEWECEVVSNDNVATFEVTVLDKDKKYYKFKWQVEKYMGVGPLNDCWLTTAVSQPVSTGSSI